MCFWSLFEIWFSDEFYIVKCGIKMGSKPNFFISKNNTVRVSHFCEDHRVNRVFGFLFETEKV